MEKAKINVVFWGMFAVVVAITATLVLQMPAKAFAATSSTQLTAATVKGMNRQTDSVQKPPSTKAPAKTTAYIDVNKKVIDQVGINAINYVKKHLGFKGVVSGKKFYPNKTFNRAQFLKILSNFYGVKKVPVSFSDVQNANKAVTNKYVTSKLVAVGKKLGVAIKWNEKKNFVLTRAGVSNYIKVFSQFNKAFKPLH